MVERVVEFLEGVTDIGQGTFIKRLRVGKVTIWGVIKKGEGYNDKVYFGARFPLVYTEKRLLESEGVKIIFRGFPQSQGINLGEFYNSPQKKERNILFMKSPRGNFSGKRFPNRV